MYLVKNYMYELMNKQHTYKKILHNAHLKESNGREQFSR